MSDFNVYELVPKLTAKEEAAMAELWTKPGHSQTAEYAHDYYQRYNAAKTKERQLKKMYEFMNKYQSEAIAYAKTLDKQ